MRGWLTGGLVVAVMSLVAPSGATQDKLVIGRDAEVLHTDHPSLEGTREVDLLPANKYEDYDAAVVAALLGVKLDLAKHRVYGGFYDTRRSATLKNALAGYWKRKKAPFIVYDVRTFGDPDFDDKNTGSRLLALADELGHHICGHLSGVRILRGRERELEADRFAGAALRNLKSSHPSFDFDRELPYIRRSFSKIASASHPPFAERMRAVMTGYREGSPCKVTQRIKDSYYPRPEGEW